MRPESFNLSFSRRPPNKSTARRTSLPTPASRCHHYQPWPAAAPPRTHQINAINYAFAAVHTATMNRLPEQRPALQTRVGIAPHPSGGRGFAYSQDMREFAMYVHQQDRLDDFIIRALSIATDDS
jgi:hypothetical protein